MNLSHEVPREHHRRNRTDGDESFFGEVIRFAFVAILVVLPIRVFIAQPFIVAGASMDPTLENGDYLIVDELSYRFTEPERGDVIIFRFPQDPSKYFVKRLIGLPGDTIDIRDGVVAVASGGSTSAYVLAEPYLKAHSRDNLTVRLSEQEYFVLGDNRPSSSDSRVWGPLPRKNIIGRALIRLLPVTAIDVLPGKVEYP